MPENVQELLENAEEAARAGDFRTSGILVNAVLKVDIRNARAWNILHQQYGNGKPFAEFQHDFAQRYYPQEAALLDAPSEGPEVFGQTSPSAEYGQAADTAAGAAEVQPTVIMESSKPAFHESDLGEIGKIACPHCNGLNDPMSTYCLFCGGKLVMNNVTPPPAAEILEEERQAEARNAAEAAQARLVEPVATQPEPIVRPNTASRPGAPAAKPSWIRIYGPWFLWTVGWIPFWLLLKTELAPAVLLNVALEALASITGLTLIRSESTFARRSGWTIAILALVSVLVQALLVIRAYIPGVIPF